MLHWLLRKVPNCWYIVVPQFLLHLVLFANGVSATPRLSPPLPSLLPVQEEQVEDAVMALNSFSGSALSAQGVLDYLLLLLLKGQEPLVTKVGGAGGRRTLCFPTPLIILPRPSYITAPPHQMHTRLLNHQMRVPESMSETEYLMALDQLAPSAPDKLRHHLFNQAVAMAAEEGSVEEARGLLAPVADLACIH